MCAGILLDLVGFRSCFTLSLIIGFCLVGAGWNAGSMINRGLGWGKALPLPLLQAWKRALFSGLLSRALSLKQAPDVSPMGEHSCMQLRVGIFELQRTVVVECLA